MRTLLIYPQRTSHSHRRTIGAAKNGPPAPDPLGVRHRARCRRSLHETNPPGPWASRHRLRRYLRPAQTIFQRASREIGSASGPTSLVGYNHPWSATTTARGAGNRREGADSPSEPRQTRRTLVSPTPSRGGADSAYFMFDAGKCRVCQTSAQVVSIQERLGVPPVAARSRVFVDQHI